MYFEDMESYGIGENEVAPEGVIELEYPLLSRIKGIIFIERQPHDALPFDDAIPMDMYGAYDAATSVCEKLKEKGFGYEIGRNDGDIFAVFTSASDPTLKAYWTFNEDDANAAIEEMGFEEYAEQLESEFFTAVADKWYNVSSLVEREK